MARLLWFSTVLMAALTSAALARDSRVPVPQSASRPSYRLAPVESKSLRDRYAPDRLALLEKLNRRDVQHLLRLDEMIVPAEWGTPVTELDHSPWPVTWQWAASHPKLLVVSQPAQVFGAYEHGRMVRWGPVSSGREAHRTPDGIFALTWKSRSRRSTVDEDWLMEWYFNFMNDRGISFHQYALPGVPASHACVRLLERDARWLFDWGETWTLSDNGQRVLDPGSTVVVLGQYDFDSPPPWTSLDWWTRLPLELPADPSKQPRATFVTTRSAR